MASNAIKEADIKYLNKDFQGFKRDLMQYAQAHFSGVFGDYNEASPGMMLLELQAYVGDVLSFYMDQQFNEMRMQTAQQTKNVALFAKSKGYRPRGPSAAQATQAFFVEVPAQLSGADYVPDYSYAPRLMQGARVQGPNGVFFETSDVVNFASSSDEQPLTKAVTKRDATTGNPTYFALKKTTIVTAGKTVTEDVSVGNFEQFYRYELKQPDVLEIISVVDSAGNTWYETDFLSQDTVMVPVANADPDNDTVPYVIKFVTVPRRFVVDRDIVSGKTSLQFGSGDGVSFDDEIVPNISDMALPVPGRGYYNNFVLDPQNFLKTTSLGMSPMATTLTVTYRVGGGAETNVPANTVKIVDSFQYDWQSNSLIGSKAAAVISSLETTNVTKADGGSPSETVSEIKANADSYFAAQQRAVTREDYIAHIMSMPAKFGRPEKVYITRDNVNPLALDIHMLAKNANNNLQIATPTLKNNVARYLKRLRMLTDGVNILDGKIINFGVSFGVVVSSKSNRVEVLSQCLSVIKDYFNIDRMQIGQPIVKSDVETQLHQVAGVISVYDLSFTNLFGNVAGFDYSTVRHDFSTPKNGIIYCPQDSIFEIKNPNVDIVGETK